MPIPPQDSIQSRHQYSGSGSEERSAVISQTANPQWPSAIGRQIDNIRLTIKNRNRHRAANFSETSHKSANGRFCLLNDSQQCLAVALGSGLDRELIEQFSVICADAVVNQIQSIVANERMIVPIVSGIG